MPICHSVNIDCLVVLLRSGVDTSAVHVAMQLV